jgi:hypothetical protein
VELDGLDGDTHSLEGISDCGLVDGIGQISKEDLVGRVALGFLLGLAAVVAGASCLALACRGRCLLLFLFRTFLFVSLLFLRILLQCRHLLLGRGRARLGQQGLLLRGHFLFFNNRLFGGWATLLPRGFSSTTTARHFG